MTPKVITIIGLGVELIGVSILWRFGWPQPQLEGGVGYELEDDTPVGNGLTAGQVKADVERRRANYKIASRLGFGILVVGLVIQALAQAE